MTIVHVVVTRATRDEMRRVPTGRARIDLEKCLADYTDHNGQGWMFYRTARGRVIGRIKSQWANITDIWTADTEELADAIGRLGIDLDTFGDTSSVVGSLEEV